MENKICQSCSIPITSNEQLGTNKDEALIWIIANIAMNQESLLTKLQWKNI